ncbi:hypothetical protein [Arenibacter aquaticus]|uniref:hypothetical protein n=1 Tax=Arenibacter aquaticus TaxID=2489054 RepID=UPI001304935E|nr:hypothetical protein [Arenibacter aquaticus]
MAIKQGEEDAKFVKKEEDKSRNYIFQDNKKTIIGAIIIMVMLVVIIMGIVLSGVFLES